MRPNTIARVLVLGVRSYWRQGAAVLTVSLPTALSESSERSRKFGPLQPEHATGGSSLIFTQMTNCLCSYTYGRFGVRGRYLKSSQVGPRAPWASRSTPGAARPVPRKAIRGWSPAPRSAKFASFEAVEVGLEQDAATEDPIPSSALGRLELYIV
jgi:hypothetical protein